MTVFFHIFLRSVVTLDTVLQHNSSSTTVYLAVNSFLSSHVVNSCHIGRHPPALLRRSVGFIVLGWVFAIYISQKWSHVSEPHPDALFCVLYTTGPSNALQFCKSTAIHQLTYFLVISAFFLTPSINPLYRLLTVGGWSKPGWNDIERWSFSTPGSAPI